ncbi:hypothetical protein CONLIGDRAFT_143768 [Coniochaeta ligniaria NRRL 30616]|uniref:Uncharacterized protein n=1 Tax=Coniochaeta ligniaria NRRL 30616 TaxID=1408157 RepID=A0A1J7J001_9PEZI|nr:hypothetical protein CONLIGDRAFT_143768 [Coniochaeta ligniaria NRRL 30616]
MFITRFPSTSSDGGHLIINTHSRMVSFLLASIPTYIHTRNRHQPVELPDVSNRHPYRYWHRHGLWARYFFSLRRDGYTRTGESLQATGRWAFIRTTVVPADLTFKVTTTSLVVRQKIASGKQSGQRQGGSCGISPDGLRQRWFVLGSSCQGQGCGYP